MTADTGWLREHIRDVPDFPEPGVVFKDITPLLGNIDAFRFAVDALADHFVQSGFDQKELLRTVLNSRVFQLSSATREENQDDQVFYSHYPVRRLPAEVLHDAICAVTGVPESRV